MIKLNKIKVCVISTSRADYGLLRNTILKIHFDKDFSLDLLITGSHNNKTFGNSISEIEKDNILFTHISFPKSLTSVNIFKTSFSKKIVEFFDRSNPDIILLLGDRLETFLIASIAYIQKIPIAHISGGELTIGSLDDGFRHAITKLSYFHFVSNKEYHNRVLQLGEEKKRVFITGNLASENIRNLKLIGKSQIEKFYNIKLMNKIIIITYHPMTLQKNYTAEDFDQLLIALKHFDNIQYIFTSPNIDKGHELINDKIQSFLSLNKSRGHYIKNLGQLNYFSLIKISNCVIGNSSSGIIEVPMLGKQSINIGDRQKGRIIPSSVISSKPYSKAIIRSINQIYYNKKKITRPYQSKLNASNIILRNLKKLNVNTTKYKLFNDI
jgi:GDP/UDP-N,N'-diacetylbacillosamine 2-epimerase (hydrolysing)